jgi:hypothetical protein
MHPEHQKACLFTTRFSGYHGELQLTETTPIPLRFVAITRDREYASRHKTEPFLKNFRPKPSKSQKTHLTLH